MEINQKEAPNEQTVNQTTGVPTPPTQPQEPAQAPQEQQAQAPQETSKKEDKKKIKKTKDEEFKPTFKIEFIKEIQALPELDDPKTIDVRYPVIDPYVSIHIYWDKNNNELAYDVEEPELTDDEKKKLAILQEGLTELINFSFINIKDEKMVLEFVEKNLRVLIDEFSLKITEETFPKLMYYIYRDFIGMSKIEGLMRDYYIEDVECNGSKTPIYIVHRKYSNLRTNIIFPDNKELSSFVEKLAQRCGQYISYANPLLDGVLPDGSRVNSTYTQDISAHGPTFTIRKFTTDPWTPIKLMDFRTVSPEILAYLWLAIENKASIMIIGGTGSGKTSFLNAIAFFIPPSARVVSIEDTQELNLRHENWLPSVARAGVGLASITGEKHGEVTLFDLLKESLRQRPDYIIVGEVRGKEAFVLFQGMSTGHPSFGTFHAESVETMIQRLETPPINLSPSLVEALDITCMVSRTKYQGKDVRRLLHVTEVVHIGEGQDMEFKVPFVRDPATDKFLFKTDSKVFRDIMQRSGMAWPQLLKEFQIRTNLLMEMYRRKIFGFQEVQEVITRYYKVPKEVLTQFGLS
ncbi:MAG: type II/IV secretion system ATPase subunit [archaeon]